MIILPKADYLRLEGIAKYGYDFKKKRFVPSLTRDNAQMLLREALSETIMKKEAVRT